MKLIVEDHWQTDQKLIDRLFFEQLVDYLINRAGQLPTLRDIKQTFPNVKVDRAMENYIRLGLIARSERRYKLLVPIYLQAETDDVIQSKFDQAKVMIAPWPKEKRRAWFFYQGQQLANHPQLYLTDSDSPLLVFRELIHEQLKVYELSDEEYDKTMPAYFTAMRSEAEKRYEQFSYLGDVDPSYYLDQVAVLFEKLRTNPKRVRPSIFLKSLVDFGFLTEDCQLVASSPSKTDSPSQEDEILVDCSQFEQRSILGQLWHFFEDGAYSIVEQGDYQYATRL